MTTLTLFKLPYNQELVAESSFPTVTDGYFYIEKPRYISYSPAQDGSGGFEVGLMPFSPIHQDGTFRVNERDFLSITQQDLPELLLTMYKSHTLGLQLS